MVFGDVAHDNLRHLEVVAEETHSTQELVALVHEEGVEDRRGELDVAIVPRASRVRQVTCLTAVVVSTLTQTSSLHVALLHRSEGGVVETASDRQSEVVKKNRAVNLLD